MRKGWEVKKLGDVCEIFNGLWKGKKPPFIEVGVIRNTNFTKEGYLNDTDIAYLPIEVKQFNKRKLEYGDLILEKSGGGPKQPVGRVIIFTKKEGEFSFSNFTSVIRVVNKHLLDFNYLHRFLFNEHISGKTKTMQRRSIGIRNLQLKEYKQIQIPIPPLLEQQRIVKILNESFTAIDKIKQNTQQNIKNAKELFDSYLNGIFATKGDDWEEKKLREVCQKTETINPKLNPTKEFIYIDVSSVNKERKIIEKTTILMGKDAPSRARKLVKTNDIIFATVRPTHSRVALITPDYNNQVCSTGYYVLRVNSDIDNNIIYYFLLTYTFNKQMEKLQKGANYPAVTNKEVESQIISFPRSKSKQKEIVQKLDQLQTQTQELEAIYRQKIINLVELKKSILQKAFKGEL